MIDVASTPSPDMLQKHTSVDLQALQVELVRDEGLKNSAYQDSLGFWTIGVGRLIDRRKGGRLTDEECLFLLRNDIQSCLTDIQSETWYLAADTDGRRRALLNLRFQLGASGLRSFNVFLGYCSNKDWANAAKDLSQTKLAHQCPDRIARICKLLLD